jgi:hypothetical protein
MNYTPYMLAAVIALIGGMFMGMGMERDYMMRADGDVMFAYGCGRHNATRPPNADPLEYEGCDNVREMWEWSERWPRDRGEPCADRKHPPQWCEGIR